MAVNAAFSTAFSRSAISLGNSGSTTGFGGGAALLAGVAGFDSTDFDGVDGVGVGLEIGGAGTGILDEVLVGAGVAGFSTNFIGSASGKLNKI
jgi:hypothetical protein